MGSGFLSWIMAVLSRMVRPCILLWHYIAFCDHIFLRFTGFGNIFRIQTLLWSICSTFIVRAWFFLWTNTGILTLKSQCLISLLWTFLDITSGRAPSNFSIPLWSLLLRIRLRWTSQCLWLLQRPISLITLARASFLAWWFCSLLWSVDFIALCQSLVNCCILKALFLNTTSRPSYRLACLDSLHWKLAFKTSSFLSNVWLLIVLNSIPYDILV